MEKEIGGYLGLERAWGPMLHEEHHAVNSGRNALLYIIRAQKIRKLYIPRFLCDTVWELCKRESIPYEEYGIDRHFRPVFERKLGEGEWLYIVNFYGQLTEDEVLAYKKQYGRIVVDNVQAYFTPAAAGVDTVYSCRKFFGVPDGGFAACDEAFPLETDASRDRMTHILGRFEVSGSAFYSQFQQNDEGFYELPLMSMSPITENILRTVDYDRVRMQRNENYKTLHSVLGKQNALVLTAPEGPYCYPFYCENGMAVKRLLAQKKIYVPTLWPNVLDTGNDLEKDYAQNILPLPVDQRYGECDMQRMLEELMNCMHA